MSDDNKDTNNTGANANDENLKNDWKVVGKGLGKTFSGLGKTLVKTAKVGIEKADDWAEGRENTDHSEEVKSMKEGWNAFGNNFVDSATDLGKTTVKTVKQGVDACTNDDNTQKESTDSADGNSTGDSSQPGGGFGDTNL